MYQYFKPRIGSGACNICVHSLVPISQYPCSSCITQPTDLDGPELSAMLDNDPSGLSAAAAELCAIGDRIVRSLDETARNLDRWARELRELASRRRPA